jgi:DNA adenine methylase
MSFRDPIVKNGDTAGPIVINGEPDRRSSSLLTSLEEYPGGKGGAGVWQAIINQFPPHDVYIESFLGSGRVLRMKKPALASIAIDSDPAVCQSWNPELYPEDLTVINGDAISFLSSYKWTGSEVVYCDPPYLRSVRSCQRDLYRNEFDTEKQHRELLNILQKSAARIVISGYDSPLYRKMLSTWRVVTIPTVNRAGKRVEELIWCNYPEPFALHDYRHLGTNFRQRERIKRKKNRWRNRLSKMPLLERAAVLAAIDEGAPSDHRPLCLDLCCGKGGWAKGFIAEGWQVVGVDLLDFSEVYPGEFIQADLLKWEGWRKWLAPGQSRRPLLIVSSTPCDEFARFGMPWTRKKNPPQPSLALWNRAKFIAEALGVPLVQENVRSAQQFVGKSNDNCGPFHLWGKLPPLPKFTGKKKESFSGTQKADRAIIPEGLARHLARCFLLQRTVAPL